MRLSIAAQARGRRAERNLTPAQAESARLYVHIGELLGEVGARLAELDCVAFGCGPGSFTGVRLAATAAQALGYGLGIRVCRRSSLAVLAAGALRSLRARRVAVCVDARMGRAYFGLYGPAGEGDVLALQPDALIVPDHLALPPGPPCVAVGSGWAVWPQLTEHNSGQIAALQTELLPSASELLNMAGADFASDRLVSPELALPDYLAHGPVVARPQSHQESDRNVP